MSLENVEMTPEQKAIANEKDLRIEELEEQVALAHERNNRDRENIVNSDEAKLKQDKIDELELKKKDLLDTQKRLGKKSEMYDKAVDTLRLQLKVAKERQYVSDLEKEAFNESVDGMNNPMDMYALLKAMQPERIRLSANIADVARSF